MADLVSDLPGATPAFSAEDPADLVTALKTKLHEVTEKNPEFMDSLSPNVRKRVDALREIQSKLDDLEAKFFEERMALEAKYQEQYEPLYAKRNDIVNGVVEVEGISDGGAVDHVNGQSGVVAGKGVPNFWLTAMKNNEILVEEISKRDEGALQYLRDIKCCRFDGSKGFKLDFFFDPNPYFKNSVLTKMYHMINEDECILEKAVGTEIEWFQGRSLTQKILKKKPKNGAKNNKPVIKTEDCESFFNLFNPPQIPDDEDIDEDTALLLQSEMEQDYCIGSTIKNKLIPRAVSWFTGEAAPSDEFEESEVEEEDKEEEEEDEADDKDEYESHEDEKGSKKLLKEDGSDQTGK